MQPSSPTACAPPTATTGARPPRGDGCDNIVVDTATALRARDAKGSPDSDATQTLVQQSPRLIRRLLPIECERLMNWPDGHVCLCGEKSDPQRCTCADGARYRACGNGVVSSVVEWIARRLAGAR